MAICLVLVSWYRVLRGEWCVTQRKGCWARSGGACGGEGKQTYRSGLFWVSMTAATGMPKLETGPQKSVQSGRRG